MPAGSAIRTGSIRAVLGSSTRMSHVAAIGLRSMANGEDQHGAAPGPGCQGRTADRAHPWRTMTCIAALRHDRVDAPFVLDGPVNGAGKRRGVPRLRGAPADADPSPGDVMIMDELQKPPFPLTGC